MKPGRGPTQIFLGVEPLKLVCKMQPPPVRPAIRKDVGTPARGRFCSLLVRPRTPPPRPGPGVSQRLRLGYSSGQWAPVHLSGHRRGRGSHQGTRGAIFPWAARWSAEEQRLGPHGA